MRFYIIFTHTLRLLSFVRACVFALHPCPQPLCVECTFFSWGLSSLPPLVLAHTRNQTLQSIHPSIFLSIHVPNTKKKQIARTRGALEAEHVQD